MKKDTTKNVMDKVPFDEVHFTEKLHRYYDELKWLYCELFKDEANLDTQFADLVKLVEAQAKKRMSCFTALDEQREKDAKWYLNRNFISMMLHVENFSGTLKDMEKRLPYLVESNVNCIYFLPSISSSKLTVKVNSGKKKNGSDKDKEQKDFIKLAKKCHENSISICLNLSINFDESEVNSAALFNNLADEMLNTANMGVDIIQINLDNIIAKWSLPHNVLRMLRIITQIAAPAVLIAGKIADFMKPAAAYFGTAAKPECQIISSNALANTIWHTVATKDAALLKHDIDMTVGLPKYGLFQNYLHSDEGLDWALDYEFLKSLGTEESAHKMYLNKFFTGKFGGSFSIGELYQNTCACGTTASLCGIEFHDKHKEKADIQYAIELDLTLHAFILSLSGVPTIYSGDEIAQYNDSDYKKHKDRKSDARYLHRGVFNWRKAGRRKIEKAIQARVYQNINKMEKLRRQYDVFAPQADVYTLDTWNKSVIAVARETADEKFIGLFNFSKEEQTIYPNITDGKYIDLLTDEELENITEQKILPYQTLWLWRKK